MNESKELQQYLFDEVVKQHIFHPQSRFKPTVGSLLLSEQKESLLHGLSLIDEIAVSLSTAAEWEEIQRDEYARLHENNAARVSVDFCMLEPFLNVSSMSTAQLLDSFADLETTRREYLQEYENRLDDIAADPLNLVDPKSITHTRYCDDNAYNEYIEALRAALAEEVPCERNYAFLSPVVLQQLELSKELLDLAPIGTVFKHENQFYTLQPHLSRTETRLTAMTIFATEFDFLRFEGEFAVTIDKIDDSEHVINAKTSVSRRCTPNSLIRAFRSTLCVFQDGIAEVGDERFPLPGKKYEELAVYHKSGEIFLAWLIDGNVSVFRSFEGQNVIAQEIKKMQQDANLLLLVGSTTSKVYNFDTGAFTELNLVAAKISRGAFLFAEFPAFQVDDVRASTFNGTGCSILYKSGLIIIWSSEKAVVFRPKERLPVLEICPRPTQRIRKCAVFGQSIFVETNAELLIWRTTDKLFTVGLQEQYNDDLLEFSAALEGSYHLCDEELTGKIIAFEDGVGIVELR